MSEYPNRGYSNYYDVSRLYSQPETNNPNQLSDLLNRIHTIQQNQPDHNSSTQQQMFSYQRGSTSRDANLPIFDDELPITSSPSTSRRNNRNEDLYAQAMAAKANLGLLDNRSNSSALDSLRTYGSAVDAPPRSSFIDDKKKRGFYEKLSDSHSSSTVSAKETFIDLSDSPRASPRPSPFIDLNIQTIDDEDQFLYGDSSTLTEEPSKPKEVFSNTGRKKTVSNLINTSWSDEDSENGSDIQKKQHTYSSNPNEMQIIDMKMKLNPTGWKDPSVWREDMYNSPVQIEDAYKPSVKVAPSAKRAINEYLNPIKSSKAINQVPNKNSESIIQFMKSTSNLQSVIPKKLDSPLHSSNAPQFASNYTSKHYFQNQNISSNLDDSLDKQRSSFETNEANILKSTQHLASLNKDRISIKGNEKSSQFQFREVDDSTCKRIVRCKDTFSKITSVEETSAKGYPQGIDKQRMIHRTSESNESLDQALPEGPSPPKNFSLEESYRIKEKSNKRTSELIYKGKPSSHGDKSSFKKHSTIDPYEKKHYRRSPQKISSDYSPKHRSRERSPYYHSRGYSPKYRSQASPKRRSRDRSPDYLRRHSRGRSPKSKTRSRKDSPSPRRRSRSRHNRYRSKSPRYRDRSPDSRSPRLSWERTPHRRSYDRSPDESSETGSSLESLLNSFEHKPVKSLERSESHKNVTTKKSLTSRDPKNEKKSVKESTMHKVNTESATKSEDFNSKTISEDKQKVDDEGSNDVKKKSPDLDNKDVEDVVGMMKVFENQNILDELLHKGTTPQETVQDAVQNYDMNEPFHLPQTSMQQHVLPASPHYPPVYPMGHFPDMHSYNMNQPIYPYNPMYIPPIQPAYNNPPPMPIAAPAAPAPIPTTPIPPDGEHVNSRWKEHVKRFRVERTCSLKSIPVGEVKEIQPPPEKKPKLDSDKSLKYQTHSSKTSRTAVSETAKEADPRQTSSSRQPISMNVKKSTQSFHKQKTVPQAEKEEQNREDLYKEYKKYLLDKFILHKTLKNTSNDSAAIKSLMDSLDKKQDNLTENPNVVRCRSLYHKAQYEMKAYIETTKQKQDLLNSAKNKLKPEEIKKLQEEFDTEVKEGKVKPNSASSHDKYSAFDSGRHWCDSCFLEFANIGKLLDHLMDDEHFKKEELTNVVATKKPVQTAINDECILRHIKGVEFVLPVLSFYCKLCDEHLINKSYAQQHLKEHNHVFNYMEFLKENPIYERKRELFRHVQISEMAKVKVKEDIEKRAKKKKYAADVDKKVKDRLQEEMDKEKDIEELDEESKSNNSDSPKKSSSIKLTLVKPDAKKELEKRIFIGQMPMYRSRLKLGDKSNQEKVEEKKKTEILKTKEFIEAKGKKIFDTMKNMPVFDEKNKVSKDIPKGKSVSSNNANKEIRDIQNKSTFSEAKKEVKDIQKSKSFNEAKKEVKDIQKSKSSFNEAKKEITDIQKSKSDFNDKKDENKQELSKKTKAAVSGCQSKYEAKHSETQLKNSKTSKIKSVDIPTLQDIPLPLSEEEKDFLMLGIDKYDMTPLVIPRPPPESLIQKHWEDMAVPISPSKAAFPSPVRVPSPQIKTVDIKVAQNIPPFPPPLQVPPPKISTNPLLLSPESVNIGTQLPPFPPPLQVPPPFQVPPPLNIPPPIIPAQNSFNQAVPCQQSTLQNRSGSSDQCAVVDMEIDSEEVLPSSKIEINKVDLNPHRQELVQKKFMPHPPSVPKKLGNEPKKLDSQPKKLDSQPKKLDSQPKKLDSVPKKLDSVPKKLDSEPKKLDSEPKKLDSEPKKLDSEPKKLDSKPSSVDSTTGKSRKSNLSKFENVDYKSSLGAKDAEFQSHLQPCKQILTFIIDEISNSKNKVTSRSVSASSTSKQDPLSFLSGDKIDIKTSDTPIKNDIGKGTTSTDSVRNQNTADTLQHSISKPEKCLLQSAQTINHSIIQIRDNSFDLKDSCDSNVEMKESTESILDSHDNLNKVIAKSISLNDNTDSGKADEIISHTDGDAKVIEEITLDSDDEASQITEVILTSHDDRNKRKEAEENIVDNHDDNGGKITSDFPIKSDCDNKMDESSVSIIDLNSAVKVASPNSISESDHDKTKSRNASSEIFEGNKSLRSSENIAMPSTDDVPAPILPLSDDKMETKTLKSDLVTISSETLSVPQGGDIAYHSSEALSINATCLSTIQIDENMEIDKPESNFSASASNNESIDSDLNAASMTPTYLLLESLDNKINSTTVQQSENKATCDNLNKTLDICDETEKSHLDCAPLESETCVTKKSPCFSENVSISSVDNTKSITITPIEVISLSDDENTAETLSVSSEIEAFDNLSQPDQIKSALPINSTSIEIDKNIDTHVSDSNASDFSVVESINSDSNTANVTVSKEKEASPISQTAITSNFMEDRSVESLNSNEVEIIEIKDSFDNSKGKLPNTINKREEVECVMTPLEKETVEAKNLPIPSESFTMSCEDNIKPLSPRPVKNLSIDEKEMVLSSSSSEIEILENSNQPNVQLSEDKIVSHSFDALSTDPPCTTFDLDKNLKTGINISGSPNNIESMDCDSVTEVTPPAEESEVLPSSICSPNFVENTPLERPDSNLVIDHSKVEDIEKEHGMTDSKEEQPTSINEGVNSGHFVDPNHTIVNSYEQYETKCDSKISTPSVTMETEIQVGTIDSAIQSGTNAELDESKILSSSDHELSSSNEPPLDGCEDMCVDNPEDSLNYKNIFSDSVLPAEDELSISTQIKNSSSLPIASETLIVSNNDIPQLDKFEDEASSTSDLIAPLLDDCEDMCIDKFESSNKENSFSHPILPSEYKLSHSSQADNSSSLSIASETLSISNNDMPKLDKVEDACVDKFENSPENIFSDPVLTAENKLSNEVDNSSSLAIASEVLSITNNDIPQLDKFENVSDTSDSIEPQLDECDNMCVDKFENSNKENDCSDPMLLSENDNSSLPISSETPNTVSSSNDTLKLEKIENICETSNSSFSCSATLEASPNNGNTLTNSALPSKNQPIDSSQVDHDNSSLPITDVFPDSRKFENVSVSNECGPSLDESEDMCVDEFENLPSNENSLTESALMPSESELTETSEMNSKPIESSKTLLSQVDIIPQLDKTEIDESVISSSVEQLPIDECEDMCVDKIEDSPNDESKVIESLSSSENTFTDLSLVDNSSLPMAAATSMTLSSSNDGILSLENNENDVNMTSGSVEPLPFSKEIDNKKDSSNNKNENAYGNEQEAAIFMYEYEYSRQENITKVAEDFDLSMIYDMSYVEKDILKKSIETAVTTEAHLDEEKLKAKEEIKDFEINKQKEENYEEEKGLKKSSPKTEEKSEIKSDTKQEKPFESAEKNVEKQEIDVVTNQEKQKENKSNVENKENAVGPNQEQNEAGNVEAEKSKGNDEDSDTDEYEDADTN